MLLKGVYAISHKNLIKGLIALPFAVSALLYGGGYLSQFLYNYEVWQTAAGTLYSGTSPQLPDPAFLSCVQAAVRFPYGLYGIGICLGLLGLLILMVMRMGYSDTGEYDSATSANSTGLSWGNWTARWSASRKTPGSTAISPCMEHPARKRPGPSVSI